VVEPGRYPQEFRTARGYDITNYSPPMFIEARTTTVHHKHRADFDTPDATARAFRHTYYETSPASTRTPPGGGVVWPDPPHA